MAASISRYSSPNRLSEVAQVSLERASIGLPYHVLPITALESCQTSSESFILAGTGTIVQVLDLGSARVRAATEVFVAQAVHGISRLASRNNDPERQSAVYLVWGGRSLRITKVISDKSSKTMLIKNLSREVSMDDWILDVHCLSRSEPSHRSSWEALVLSSHNRVHIVHFHENLLEGLIDSIRITPVAVGPTSMLYSANMVTVDEHIIYIASGTVFGEILLWTFRLTPRVDANRIETGRLLQRYRGHEGSVFGVKLVDFPNTSSLQGTVPAWIVSCSDDRTIRIWDYPTRIPLGERDPLFNSSYLEVETGFNRGRASDHDQGVAVTSAMGHSSRIWSLRPFPTSASFLRILSSGEDGTTQVWQIAKKQNSNQKDPLEAHLQHIATKAYHTGKNIWATALVYDPNFSEPKVTTGGADGRIVVFDVDDRWSQKSLEDVHLTLSNFLRNAEISAISPMNYAGKPRSPTRSLFQSMRCKWTLFRTIRSKLPTYPSGIFRGTATITPKETSNKAYDLESLYEEEGTLTTEQGPSLRGTRRYIYRYQEETDAISAWFVKPESKSTVDYLFHKVRFTTRQDHNEGGLASNLNIRKAQGHHLCIDDDYDAEYEFKSRGERLDTWSIKYQVIGPKKDYTLSANYTRQSELSPNGGADKQVLQSQPEENEPFTKRDPTGHVLAHSILNAYCWLNGAQLLVTTDTGHVARGTLIPNGEANLESGLQSADIVWDYINYNPDLSSWSLVKGIEELNTALLTGSNGVIYSVSGRKRSLDQVTRFPSKVTSLLVQEFSKVDGSLPKLDSIGVLATCLDFSTFVFRLHLLQTDETDNLLALAITSLALPTNTIVTSAHWLENSSVETLIVGSRSGALFIFQNPYSDGSDVQIPPICIRRVHIEDSITVIQSLPMFDIDVDPFLLTAGRDGRYAIHRLLIDKHQRDQVTGVKTVHEGEPPFGPNIEGAMFDAITRDLILWGFKGRHFIVWNESKERELMKIDCGGAHRNWAYYREHNSLMGGKLIWTKASVCHLRIHLHPPHRVLRDGTHGREIKAVAVWPSSTPENRSHLMATGAEDTTIRIIKYSESINAHAEHFEHLGLIRKHRTGIQQLHWSPGGQYLFSSGGYEELYIWRVQSIPGAGVGITQNCQCPAISDSCDLRIMDFDIYLEIQAANGAEESFIVSAIYSDSSVRVWRCKMQGSEGGFDLLYYGLYTTCCLTQIRMILSKSVLMTAGTDGFVASWSIPAITARQQTSSTTPINHTCDPTPLALLSRQKVHQNTIKSMTLLSSFPDTILATGGDDNALAIIRVEEIQGEPVRLKYSTLFVPTAHASAINTVQAWNEGGSLDNNGKVARQSGFMLMTTGNDQRIKRWYLSVDLDKPGVEGFCLERLTNKVSSVADASCIALLSSDDTKVAAVVGVGIEIVRT